MADQFPNNEPIVETVPNDDQVSENDSRMSEILGIKVKTSIGKDDGFAPADEPSDEPSDEPQGSEEPIDDGEEPGDGEQQPEGQDGGEEDDDFWGKPDEAGNYTLGQDKLAYLRNALASAAANMQQREKASQEAINAYRAKLDAVNRQIALQRQQQMQQGQQPPAPQKSPLQEAREKMIADLVASGASEEKAKEYVDNQTALFKAAVAEQGNANLRAIQPWVSRVQENAYREDVSNITKVWGGKIASNLGEFNVPPEECYKNVAEYVKHFIPSFTRTHGRRPTQAELYNQLAADSGTLGSMTLSDRLHGIINERQKQAAASRPAPAVAPKPAPPAPKPQDTVSSVTAAQKRVTSGENLRMANDAGIMGTTPSSGSNEGNSDHDRMAKMLSEANGGNFYFNS